MEKMIKIKRFNKTGNEEFENKIEELCSAGKKNKLESTKVQKLLKQLLVKGPHFFVRTVRLKKLILP